VDGKKTLYTNANTPSPRVDARYVGMIAMMPRRCSPAPPQASLPDGAAARPAQPDFPTPVHRYTPSGPALARQRRFLAQQSDRGGFVDI